MTREELLLTRGGFDVECRDGPLDGEFVRIATPEPAPAVFVSYKATALDFDGFERPVQYREVHYAFNFRNPDDVCLTKCTCNRETT